MILHKKVGDPVDEGEPLCTLLVNDESRLGDARSLIAGAYAIADEPVEPEAADRRAAGRPTLTPRSRLARSAQAMSRVRSKGCGMLSVSPRFCPAFWLLVAFAGGARCGLGRIG